jgi:hypothetical protein
MNTKLKKYKKTQKNKNINIMSQFSNLKDSNLKDSTNNDDIKNNECFICLELLHNDETVIKLNESIYYKKICDCNAMVHNYCLNKWYSFTYICPICRTNIFSQQVPVSQNIVIINNGRQNSSLHHFIIIVSKMNTKLVIILSIAILYYMIFIQK